MGFTPPGGMSAAELARLVSMESAVAGLGDALTYRGAIDASGNPNYPAADAGHTYKISVAGKIGGASGATVQVGDAAICTADGTAAGTQAAVGASWTIIQSNLDVATTSTLGTVKMATAPASAANPIAAGDNDPRLTDARAAITLPWVTGTVYAAGQTVIDGGRTYIAKSAHTAGATFRGDIAAKWRLLPTALARPTAFGTDWVSASGRYPRLDFASSLFTNGTDTQMNTKLRHLLAHDVVAVRLVYLNTRVGENCTIKAAVEASDGSKAPAFFNGARSKVLEAALGLWNATSPPTNYVVSDPVGIKGAKNTAIWSRTFATVTSGEKLAVTHVLSETGEACETGTAVGDKTLTGTIAAATTLSFGPSWILFYAPDGAISIVGLGDSIVDGWGGSAYHTGPIRLACDGKLPYHHAARGGEKSTEFQASSWIDRHAQSQGGTHVIHQYGINDLQAAATAAATEASMLANWKTLANDDKRVYQTTITPKSASSDAWATTANQTTDATVNPPRLTVNAWIRDGAPIDATTLAVVATGTVGALRAGDVGHPLVGYIEWADAVESARDSGKWTALYTADGIHPSEIGKTALATVTGTLIDQLVLVSR